MPSAKSTFPLLLFLLWTLGSYSRADGIAQDCANVLPKIVFEKKNSRRSTHLSDQDRSYLTNILRGLHSSGLLDHLAIPGQLAVKGSDEASGFVRSTSTIQLRPIAPINFAPPRTDPERFVKAIFVHEFGHALFHENHINFVAKTPEQKKAASQLLSVEDRGRVPYEELFSDLVAALYFKDPSIMRKALAESRTEDSPAYAYREFRGDYDLKLWKNEEEHAALAPTRGFLGSFFDAELLSDRQKSALFLSTVLHVCLEQAENKRLSVSEMNRELIERLKEELAKAGY
jgi:hypothetical protein